MILIYKKKKNKENANNICKMHFYDLIKKFPKNYQIYNEIEKNILFKKQEKKKSTIKIEKKKKN